MPSRFTQYGGVAGADGALREMVAARIQAQMEAERVAQERYKLQQDDMRIKLAQTQEKRMGDFQNKQFEDMALNRESQRVDRMHEDAMPDDKLSAADAALYRKHGRGGALRTITAPTVTAEQVKNAPHGDPTDPTIEPALAAGDTTHRGGSKYLAGREAAADRAAAQGAQISAANERAEADRELRETIARLSASNTAESRALANQLKQLQIDKATDERTTAVKDRESARTASQATAGNAVSIVERLLNNPDGIAKATGAYELRGFTQGAKDARADIDTLVDSLALPNLGQLKGPLSDKDIVFVRNTVTKLQNPNISYESAVAELNRLKPMLEKAYAHFGGAGAAGGAPPPAGRPLTARNPQTGETLVSDDGGKTWHK